MDTMNLQPLKGFRDFLPKESKKRQYVMNILRNVFESYGFEPLETPALEYEKILTGKYGEEGEKLMYRFEDNGKRKVALRYDQTVPLSRVVARFQNELPVPFKRYQIQPVWRADNTQKGRYREFLHCDADTAGIDSALADAEVITCAIQVLKKLGLEKFKVSLNDRTTFAGINPKAIPIIDKLPKIGEEAVRKYLQNAGLEETILDDIRKRPQTKRLTEIITVLQTMGIDASFIEYSPTLARGLDYYTGLIFEITIDNYKAGSVCGGGRYDNLIGMFAGRQIPAVGFAFGFDRLMDAMDELQLFPKDLTTTKVLVTIFSPALKDTSMKISSFLRTKNINTELYLDENAKLDKQLKYADKKQIPYVAIIGPDEEKNDEIVLKNLKTSTQKKVNQKELATILTTDIV